MKRFLCLFTALFIFFSSSCYADTITGIDYSKLTKAELTAIRDEVQAEIDKRIKKKIVLRNNGTLVNDDILYIKFTGNGTNVHYDNNDGDNYFKLEIEVQNKYSSYISIYFETVIINGWDATKWDCIYSIAPKNKRIGYIALPYSLAGLKSHKEMSEIEIKFRVSLGGKEQKYYGPLLFDFDGAGWD